MCVCWCELILRWRPSEGYPFPVFYVFFSYLSSVPWVYSFWNFFVSFCYLSSGTWLYHFCIFKTFFASSVLNLFCIFHVSFLCLFRKFASVPFLYLNCIFFVSHNIFLVSFVPISHEKMLFLLYLFCISKRYFFCIFFCYGRAWLLLINLVSWRFE